MKTSIALIGFMGAGKTAVGKALAKKLGKEFVELDSLIERKAGKSIPEIFQQDGEVAFRELEIEVTKRLVLSEAKDLVIACGGGIILNKINIDRLKNEAIIVYLTASPRVLLSRISHSGGERPLLHSELSAVSYQLSAMLKFRKPFYDRAADIKINTTKLDIDSVAEEIIRSIQQCSATL